MALQWEDSVKGQWPLPAFLSGRELSSTSNLDARYFSSSLSNTTGAFQAANPMLELRGSESEKVSPCKGSLKELLVTPEVSSTDSIPTGFCSQKFGGLTFLALEPWVRGPDVELGLPRYPSGIIIHHIWVREQTTPHLHPSCQSG